MELLLALTVIASVILFGALISLGNERQCKAIDELREQVVLWAIQDLRIKREYLARDVKVDNPLSWLNRIARKACGHDLNLEIMETSEWPEALYCSIKGGNGRVIFTPLSPTEVRKFRKEKRDRLYSIKTKNQLYLLPIKVESYELSTLNNGPVFDLELHLVWKELTGSDVFEIERIWMYII